MAGKIVPYILIGYVQVVVILVAARLLFEVPMVGSLALLSAMLVLFIAANLAVGFTFSTLARNQLQAMQMTFFFFLPSMLLSGFMFPFRGMPGWAQAIGEVLPLTHFLRIVRGILLKGNQWADIALEVAALAAFLVAAAAIALATLPRNPRLSAPRARDCRFALIQFDFFPPSRVRYHELRTSPLQHGRAADPAMGGPRPRRARPALRGEARAVSCPRPHAALAFADMEIPIGHGEAMMQPKVEARILQELGGAPEERCTRWERGPATSPRCSRSRARHVTSAEIHDGPARRRRGEPRARRASAT